MKRILITSILGLTIGFTAACGGSDDTASTSRTASADQQQSGGRSPGGSGEVVEVSGSTAQVKGADSQAAVKWTDNTDFTKQVSGSAGDVLVGSCVMVMPADPASSSTETVAAGSVRITEKTVDGCTMGGGGGGMAGPRGGGEARPGDRPTDMPPRGEGRQGAPGGGQRGGGFAAGEVTAVTDSGFTVSSQQPGADQATAVEVTISDDTTYTRTDKASADDVEVGVCVTSRGKSDDTGAIAAETIAVTAQVDGECSMGGFGGGRPEGAPDGPDAGDAV